MQVTRILELSKVRLLLINTGVFHRTHVWDAVTLQAETGIQGGHAIGILLFFFSVLCSHCISSSSSCVFSTSFSQWIIQRKTNSVLPTQILLKWPCFSSLEWYFSLPRNKGMLDEPWLLGAHSLWIRFHIKEPGECYLPGKGRYFELQRQLIGLWSLNRWRPHLIISEIAFVTSIGALYFHYWFFHICFVIY